MVKAVVSCLLRLGLNAVFADRIAGIRRRSKNVSAHGLFIDDCTRPEVVIAATNRFSEMHLGFIH